MWLTESIRKREQANTQSLGFAVDIEILDLGVFQIIGEAKVAVSAIHDSNPLGTPLITMNSAKKITVNQLGLSGDLNTLVLTIVGRNLSMKARVFGFQKRHKILLKHFNLLGRWAKGTRLLLTRSWLNDFCF